jgi:hypothetical protein
MIDAKKLKLSRKMFLICMCSLQHHKDPQSFYPYSTHTYAPADVLAQA